MRRLLVTGASGFIGRALIAAFAKDGQVVRAAVRRPPQLSFGANVEVVRHADFAQSVDWRPLVEGIDTVIHLAGIAHAGRGLTVELYDRVNRQATEDLARAAANAGVGRFVFVSSVRAQSGSAADHILSERDQPAPIDDYGRAKLAAEMAVRSAGVPFTILRPVLLYGPGVKGNLALLLRAAASPLPLPVQDFTNRRSLLGIDNFISAVEFVMSSPAASGETYLVADPGPAPTLADIFVTLRQAQDRRPFIVRMSRHFIEAPLRMIRRGELWDRIGGNLQVDPAKLLAAGWRPSHDTRAGLFALVHSGRARNRMPPSTPTAKT